ncbi:MAG: M10 family metallopeptidase C-terminal domain-containing protein, partial [Defluviicoccus sp.]|nr:M10 family metallopeptidase C-terminal domain-containing protein [Defluviicoccus sp.]
MCVLCRIDPVNSGNGNHEKLVEALSRTHASGNSTTPVPGGGDDIPGDSTTTAEVKVGGASFFGTIETAGDRDWIKVTLEAGKRYAFSLESIDYPLTDYGALGDPSMILYDADGNRVAADDDSGRELDSRLGFVPPTSGTYYVEARGYRDFTGDYRLTVKSRPPQTEGSLDELADFLTHGFSFPHKFNLGRDGINAKNGVITYTLDGMSADGDGLTEGVAELAREAFRLYEAILGIDFRETSRETSSETADIRFSDLSLGGWASFGYSVSNGQGYNSAGAQINIPSEYRYLGGIESWPFYVILHEIGHVLGLGHQGHYSGFVEFLADAKFLNDSAQLSIMSYFGQTQNPHIDASSALPIGPMAVDLVALNNLYSQYGYGVSNAFTGDTIWGFNTNIDDSKGKAFSELSQYAHRNAFTIIDSGGTDTVDFSGYSADQIIDLTVTESTNPYATASSVGGLRGNMMLAAGTVIENAIGGSGDDVIIGNAEDNVLTGGAGADRFVYASADTGHDTITDFTGGEDRIDFRDLAIAFADLTIAQGSGADAAHTIISWTGAGGVTQSITLENIQASSISGADFLFDGPLEVSVADATVTEGGTAQVTVSLDRASSEDVTVWWRTADDTAGSGDYSGRTTKQKLVFKPGETSRTIEIDTTDDAVHERSETFAVTLSDPSGATLGADHTATVTITDNDARPKIAIADATVTEGGTAQVTVSLDRASSKDVMVWWRTSDGTAGSGDYSGQTTKQRIVFKPGETSKTIEIDTVDDASLESDETFTVTLSTSLYATLEADPTATVTITDDDAPEVSVAGATVAEGGTAQVTVSLDRASSKDVTVYYSTSDGTAGSGDYSGQTTKQKIVFKAGETSKVVAIKTVDDTVHEGSETFTVTLSDPSGATLGADPTATVTVTDNDAVPEITVADATVAEGGTAQVTVSLDRASSKDVTVYYSTSDGTAGSGDYSGQTTKQKIVFKAGETSKVVAIKTVDDAVHEGSETFTVTLSDPSGATLGTDPTATVTITDDDAVPEITVAGATVAEGGTAQVTVSLDRASSKDVTVYYSTSDGTAGSGDYSGPSAKQ